MSLSNTTVAQTYVGNGAITSFAIPFVFFENTQVKVSLYYIPGDSTSELVQGTDFTVTGGDPGTAISTTSTYSADYEITVYRETPKTQEADDIDTGNFRPEAFEDALDRTVMMIQELAREITLVEASGGSGGGALVVGADQAISAAGTIQTTSDQRSLIYVQGSGGAITANTTTPVEAGTIDGQELRLVGESDTNTLTITDSGNVDLNGDMVLYKNSVLDLFWSADQSLWVESSRRN